MAVQKDKIRMCIDYTELNSATTKMRYPLPNASAIFPNLAGNKFFASMDLRSGYHQLGLTDHASNWYALRLLVSTEEIPEEIPTPPEEIPDFLISCSNSDSLTKFRKLVEFFEKQLAERFKDIVRVIYDALKSGFERPKQRFHISTTKSSRWKIGIT
jgi:hypothetical protein